MCSFLFLSMIKSIDFSWIYCLSFTVVNERGNCLFSSVKNTRRFFRSKLLTQSLRIKCADCGGNHTASLRGCTIEMLRYNTHLNLIYFWKILNHPGQTWRLKCADCGGNHTIDFRGCAKLNRYIEACIQRKVFL